MSKFDSLKDLMDNINAITKKFNSKSGGIRIACTYYPNVTNPAGSLMFYVYRTITPVPNMNNGGYPPQQPYEQNVGAFTLDEFVDLKEAINKIDG